MLSAAPGPTNDYNGPDAPAITINFERKRHDQQALQDHPAGTQAPRELTGQNKAVHAPLQKPQFRLPLASAEMENEQQRVKDSAQLQ